MSHPGTRNSTGGWFEEHGFRSRIAGFGLSLALHVIVFAAWIRIPPAHLVVHSPLVWIQLQPLAPELPKPEVPEAKAPKPAVHPSHARAKPAQRRTAEIAEPKPSIEAPVIHSEAHESQAITQPVVSPDLVPKQSTSPEDYAALLAARLEQVKRYPDAARAKRQQGIALVFFTLDRSGNLRSWHVARSSGYDSLDAEVTAMMAAATPFPPFPKSLDKPEESFLVPIEFSLH